MASVQVDAINELDTPLPLIPKHSTVDNSTSAEERFGRINCHSLITWTFLITKDVTDVIIVNKGKA